MEKNCCANVNCGTGVCSVKNGEAYCTCPTGWVGDFCEINTCTLFKCQNTSSNCADGQCKNCPYNYSGPSCEYHKCGLVDCPAGWSCFVSSVSGNTSCYVWE